MIISKDQIMHIDHISVSRNQTYHECGQKYKYRYHDKLIPDKPTPFYFVYGKIVHKIAECYARGKGETDLMSIAEQVLSGKIPVEDKPLPEGSPPIKYTIPKWEVPRFYNHLAHIEQINQRLKWDGEVEMPFDFDLDPPNEAKIVGVIDRLVPKDGVYYILDYKTTRKGKWRKDRNTITTDLQLRCYGKVVQKKYGVEAENIKAALYYLDEPELISTRFTQKSLDDAQEELKQAYYQIKNHDPDNVIGTAGEHCKFCDYENVCCFNALYKINGT